MNRLKIVVLSGAGISAESGIQTFRGDNGLWEGHDITEVASPEGFHKNPLLVLDFYNKRRKQLLSVFPNYAHQRLVDLEKKFDVSIITQNVDDLHERAGSTKIMHLHGELFKVESTNDSSLIFTWKDDLTLKDKDKNGFQLRPHIVWFGEPVPKIESAIEEIKTADVLLIIGTSLQVYPAAGLINYLKQDKTIFYLDNNPAPIKKGRNPLIIINSKATEGIDQVIEELNSLKKS